MNKFRFTALLALSAFALPTSTALTQVILEPDLDNVAPRTTTQRTEKEFTLSIEAPALPSRQCEAAITTDYQQRNTLARVNSTVRIADCMAASGAYTVEVRIRDESGENKSIEFGQTWQRTNDLDVEFTADYPIGVNVELRGVRVRDLRCTCADPAKEE